MRFTSTTIAGTKLTCIATLAFAYAALLPSAAASLSETREINGYAWSYKIMLGTRSLLYAREFEDILLDISCDTSEDGIVFTSWSQGPLTTAVGTHSLSSETFDARLPAKGEYFIDTDQTFHASKLSSGLLRQISAEKKGFWLETPDWSARFPSPDTSMINDFIRDCEAPIAHSDR